MNFGHHPDQIILIPTIVLTKLKCEDCDEVHGWEIQISWLTTTIEFQIL